MPAYEIGRSRIDWYITFYGLHLGEFLLRKWGRCNLNNIHVSCLMFSLGRLKKLWGFWADIIFIWILSAV